MEKIIGLKELRKNLPYYAEKIEQGQSFLVVKKSKPIFRISSPDENNDLWEETIDFTKIKHGGIAIEELLTRL